MNKKVKYELIWLVAVIAILAISALANYNYTLSASKNIAQPYNGDPSGVVINVTGYQWGWQFEYPNGTITTDKLILMANVTYTLIVTSKDVIHDLYIPQFGVQVYAVYGHTNEVTFTPLVPGTYIMECVEYCGEYHYEMRGQVVVL